MSEFELNDRVVGSGAGVVTIDDGDTTPDIAGGWTFETDNSNPTTITNFTGGVGDRVITIIAGDDNTTIACNANIILEGAGTVDFDMQTNDTLTLALRSTGIWVEADRSVNS